MAIKDEIPRQIHERHYTVSELAGAWNVCDDTIRNWFRHEDGVIHPPQLRRIQPVAGQKIPAKRDMMRIPESVALRVYRRMTNE